MLTGFFCATHAAHSVMWEVMDNSDKKTVMGNRGENKVMEFSIFTNITFSFVEKECVLHCTHR